MQRRVLRIRQHVHYYRAVERKERWAERVRKFIDNVYAYTCIYTGIYSVPDHVAVAPGAGYRARTFSQARRLVSWRCLWSCRPTTLRISSILGLHYANITEYPAEHVTLSVKLRVTQSVYRLSVSQKPLWINFNYSATRFEELSHV